MAGVLRVVVLGIFFYIEILMFPFHLVLYIDAHYLYYEATVKLSNYRPLGSSWAIWFTLSSLPYVFIIENKWAVKMLSMSGLGWLRHFLRLNSSRCGYILRHLQVIWTNDKRTRFF